MIYDEKESSQLWISHLLSDVGCQDNDFIRECDDDECYYVATGIEFDAVSGKDVYPEDMRYRCDLWEQIDDDRFACTSADRLTHHFGGDDLVEWINLLCKNVVINLMEAGKD